MSETGTLGAADEDSLDADWRKRDEVCRERRAEEVVVVPVAVRVHGARSDKIDGEALIFK